MRTKNYIIWGILIFVMGFISCDEKTPDLYDAVDGVYFNNRQRNNTLLDSTSYTFVYSEYDTISIPIVIQSVGPQRPESRPVNIKITSENAEEGVDYVLPEKCELPANSSKFNYVVLLKRTPALQETVKTIHFEILENEYFTLPIKEEITDATNNISTSTLHFKIEFSDMFTAPPAAWNDEDICGKFSPEKLNLICKVLEIPKEDFNDPKKVTWAKFRFIRQTMSAYVEEQYMYYLYEMEYDPDIFDKDGNPLEF